MTESVRVVPSAVTVVQNKPSTAFGQQAKAPVESAEAMILSRAALSPEIPATAVVSGGLLSFTQTGAITGSITITVQPNASKFDARTTWNKRPNTASSAVSVTKTSPPSGTLWTFDVTAHVQDFISGALPNFGWRVSTTSGTRRYLKGAVAAQGKPSLSFTYETIPPPPSNLTPNGAAVSIAKPVLAWDKINGTTFAQVQIDGDADGISPTFDSGEVATTGGTFALGPTAFAGLTDAATTFWRVRVRTPGGLSGWSTWATLPRQSKGTVTITNPGATSADGTPPVQATFTGTVTSWTAKLTDTLTGTVYDSTTSKDAVIEWTPKKGVTKAGQQGTVTVAVVDDVLRVATPGDPIAAYASQTFTLTLSATVAPLDSFAIEQRGVSPVVYLMGTRSEIPDEVAIFRRREDEDAEQQIARVPGLDVFADTVFEWADLTAAPNWRYEYRVASVVNGDVSSQGTTLSIVPTCLGIWLIAEDDGTALVIWGDENETPEANDLAVVHQPATGDVGAVRRRISRPPRNSTVSGSVVDVPVPVGDGEEWTADEQLRIIDEFDRSDAGRLYRLAIGHLNLRVIAGNFAPWTDPLSGKERIGSVSFEWWGQVDGPAPA